MPIARWILPVIAVVALVGLFLLLRPDEPGQPQSASTPTPTPPATPTATTETPEPTEAPTPTPTGTLDAVEIEVEEGRVEGPARISVTQGDPVAFEVESDVTDEVHVHGYDIFEQVGPGPKTLVRFRANIPGVFEIELERSGVLLTRLEVTP